MKQILFAFLAVSTILLSGQSLASAQVKQTENAKIIQQVEALRNKLVAAIKSHDKKTLESLYADDFTHTHASGQVDDKTKRLAALASGEPTIESAQVNEIDIRVYGKATAVAIGQSAIPDANQKAAKYRWTILYFRTSNGWRIVASQATRLAEK